MTTEFIVYKCVCVRVYSWVDHHLAILTLSQSKVFPTLCLCCLKQFDWNSQFKLMI